MVRVMIFLITFIGLYTKLSGQASAPPDVASLELLIDRHKKQHDRLEERNKQEALHHTATRLVKEISTKYEKLHKDLMSMYSTGSQWVSIGINTITVLGELNELRKAIPPFLKYTTKITNPYVLLKYINASKRIKGEIDFCIKVVSAMPALRFKATELEEIVSLIKERIYSLRYYIQSYTYVIQGQVDYNRLYEKPKLPDYVQIASRVINDHFKINER